MSIQILIDPWQAFKAEGCLVVETPGDYVQSWQKIRETSWQKGSLVVVVRNPGMASYYEDTQDYYGARVQRVDPLEQLKALLQVRHLPAPLEENPGAIMELGLLGLAQIHPKGPAQRALEWILSIKWGPVWAREALAGWEDLRELVEWYLQNPWPPSSLALLRLAQEKLLSWKETAPLPGRALLEWLLADPPERAAILALVQLLQGYPLEKKAQWLQEKGRWSAFCCLPNGGEVVERLNPLKGAEDVPSVALRQGLKRYLKSFLAEKGVEEALELVAGRLRCEAEAILDHLKGAPQPEALTGDLFDRIGEAFRHLPEAAAFRAQWLTLRPWPAPSPIAVEDDWERVSSWIAQEYLPFYRWTRTVVLEARTAEPVRNFEEWLIAHYPSLTLRPDVLLYGMREEIGSLLEDAPVLWVVVDGLGLEWQEALVEHLSREGLNLQKEPGLRLALLPSITEVCKPSLIRGQLPSQFSPAEGSISEYRRLLQQAHLHQEVSATADSGREGTLFDLIEGRQRLLLYLVNDFDEKVHKAIPEAVRREKISKLLKDLAEDLAQAAGRYEERHGEMLQVVITGDHGYTSLPAQAEGLEIPSGGLEITHGRLARLSVSELPPAGDSWYLLSGEQGYLPGAYLIARGYRYFGSKPKGAVHGGMTPQEVAVPVLTLSLQSSPQVELLSLSIVGEIYRRRESQVTLKIGNPNRLQVLIEELKLEWVQTGLTLPVTIGPKGEVDLLVRFDSRSLTREEVGVSGILRYRVLGQACSQVVSLSLRTRGAAIARTDFEEDFDV